ncbi:unnamed protein product [Prorocentrum cordatum]|uniref:Uncharacterized protein n=1 Tax=Prorocentrum cordatum TaxID=2364126 RepID=A0ABN9RJI6_9DINO|nr:unnamed protein product [Polarella glacialis]
MWCCTNEQVGCGGDGDDGFDCSMGDEDIRDPLKGWSDEKKAYCCENEQVGCGDGQSAIVDDDGSYRCELATMARVGGEYCCLHQSLGCVEQAKFQSLRGVAAAIGPRHLLSLALVGGCCAVAALVVSWRRSASPGRSARAPPSLRHRADEGGGGSDAALRGVSAAATRRRFAVGSGGPASSACTPRPPCPRCEEGCAGGGGRRFGIGIGIYANPHAPTGRPPRPREATAPFWPEAPRPKPAVAGAPRALPGREPQRRAAIPVAPSFLPCSPHSLHGLALFGSRRMPRVQPLMAVFRQFKREAASKGCVCTATAACMSRVRKARKHRQATSRFANGERDASRYVSWSICLTPAA